MKYVDGWVDGLTGIIERVLVQLDWHWTCQLEQAKDNFDYLEIMITRNIAALVRSLQFCQCKGGYSNKPMGSGKGISPCLLRALKKHFDFMTASHGAPVLHSKIVPGHSGGEVKRCLP